MDRKEQEYECWHCGKPGSDCFLEEWDSFIHSECVPDFLKTEEGQVVLHHKHHVGVWRNGEIVVLHEGS